MINMQQRFRVMSLLAFGFISGCMSLPDDVSAEFQPEENEQLNHYKKSDVNELSSNNMVNL